MDIKITFDYELFLGPKTGSVDKCLIEPTLRLCKIAKPLNVKLVFFVDVLFLLKMQEFKASSYNLTQEYNLLVNNLKFLASEGHELQLHIHPQWFYSKYDVSKDKWLLDYTHYKLSDCSWDDICTMFTSGIQFLNKFNGNKTNAYRAGGFCFYNDSNFIEFISSLGIKYDSSVLSGCFFNSEYQSYDYREIVKSDFYDFSRSLYIPCKIGLLQEYPISTIKILRLFRTLVNIYFRLLKKNKFRKLSDGIGIGVLSKKKPQKHIFEYVALVASFDSLNSIWLNYIFTKTQKRRDKSFIIISHPKLLTEYSFEVFEQFLNSQFNKNNFLGFYEA